MVATIAVFIPILALMIPIIAIMQAPFRRWLEFKEKALATQTQDTAERAAQYGAHIERMEQRVRVLERIITDKNATLATEIESLRDAQLN
jgi:hypothetical protein